VIVDHALPDRLRIPHSSRRRAKTGVDRYTLDVDERRQVPVRQGPLLELALELEPALGQGQGRLGLGGYVKGSLNLPHRVDLPDEGTERTGVCAGVFLGPRWVFRQSGQNPFLESRSLKLPT
jgi:hypothetical protein